MVVKAGFDKQKLIIVSFAMFGLLWPVWNCTLCDDYKALEIDDRFRVNDLECVSKCRVCNGLLRPNVSFFSDTMRVSMMRGA